MSETLSEQIMTEAAQASRAGQMARLEGIAQRVGRLERGAEELGKSLMFWMNLAADVSGSQDCIDDDGDGDWGAVAERLAGMKVLPISPACGCEWEASPPNIACPLHSDAPTKPTA